MQISRAGSLLLVVAIGALSGFSQDGVRGPVLGFLPDARVASIRPILGIPGSSLLGHPLALEAPIRLAAVSPSQAEALVALETDPPAVSLLRFRATTFERSDLNDVEPGIDAIAFSPSGTAAAVYDEETRTLQSLKLPAAETVFKFDFSSLGSRLTAFAAADSGSFALMQIVSDRGAETWLVNAQGDHVAIPHASVFAFIPGSDEFLINDSASGLLSRVSQLDAARLQGLRVVPEHNAPELTGLVRLAMAQDGRQVFGVSEDGTTMVMDAGTGAAVSLPCYCSPSGLYPLRGRSVFRLSNPEDGPVAVLDAGGTSSARVVLIPAEGAR
jgi:hypothetical protein